VAQAYGSNLQGRVALVTGGADGIGRATAVAFATAGAKVVVADIQDDEAQITVESITSRGGQAIYVKTDVSDEYAVKALVAKVVDTYGGLDVAFNNAGIEGPEGPTADVGMDDWQKVISINLMGVWLSMKYEIPAMLERGGGAIVNTASVAGLVGFPNLPAYVASKHGVVGLTKNAALEYCTQGIRVNAVCPGVIRTEMIDRIIEEGEQTEDDLTAATPLGRLGQPEEIAKAVLWLCSEEASFVVGHTMTIDGAYVAQ
jgi:NAD(P)-dependent dehydrogenase (short-subunit alcohol dehydrogenase family)